MSLPDKLEVSLLAAAVDDLLVRLVETLTDRERNVRTLKSYTAIDAVRSSQGSSRSRPSSGGLPGAIVVGVNLGDELVGRRSAAACHEIVALVETLPDRERNVRTLKSYTAIDAVRSSQGSSRSRPSSGGLPGAIVVGVNLGD